jgi:hypothetical protein
MDSATGTPGPTQQDKMQPNIPCLRNIVDEWRERAGPGRAQEGVTISYLPTEKVFEHGFDPLVGCFNAGGEVPYQVFSQWVEVLPTDQVVAVEVEYDPKTGQLL